METEVLTLKPVTGNVCHKGIVFAYEYTPHPESGLCPTVLLGGVLQDMYSWKNYVREFSKTAPVIIADLPGTGSSGILESAKGFDFLADCLNALLETLGISQVNIFSTSYSTITAHEFAKKYPRKIARFAISSSMAKIPLEQLKTMHDCLEAARRRDLQKFADVFISGVSNRHIKAANSDLVKRVILSGISSMTELQMQQFIQNTERVLAYQDLRNKHKLIPVTPLIFTGELDTFTPPHLCKEIGNYYEGFHFRMIPGFDHFYHIGNSRLIFSTLIPFFNTGRLPEF